MTSVIPTVTCFIIKCEPRMKEVQVHPMSLLCQSLTILEMKF